MKALFDSKTKKLLVLNYQEGTPRAPYYNAGTEAEPVFQPGDYILDLTDADINLIKDRDPKTSIYDGDSGLEVAPYDVPVPTEVTARQFRLALNELGDRDSVEAVVAAAGKDVQDEWEYGGSPERHSPTIGAMQAILASMDAKWTDKYVDDLFILANSK